MEGLAALTRDLGEPGGAAAAFSNVTGLGTSRIPRGENVTTDGGPKSMRSKEAHLAEAGPDEDPSAVE